VDAGVPGLLPLLFAEPGLPLGGAFTVFAGVVGLDSSGSSSSPGRLILRDTVRVSKKSSNRSVLPFTLTCGHMDVTVVFPNKKDAQSSGKKHWTGCSSSESIAALKNVIFTPVRQDLLAICRTKSSSIVASSAVFHFISQPPFVVAAVISSLIAFSRGSPPVTLPLASGGGDPRRKKSKLKSAVNVGSGSAGGGALSSPSRPVPGVRGESARGFACTTRLNSRSCDIPRVTSSSGAGPFFGGILQRCFCFSVAISRCSARLFITQRQNWFSASILPFPPPTFKSRNSLYAFHTTRIAFTAFLQVRVHPRFAMALLIALTTLPGPCAFLPYPS